MPEVGCCNFTFKILNDCGDACLYKMPKRKEQTFLLVTELPGAALRASSFGTSTLASASWEEEGCAGSQRPHQLLRLFGAECKASTSSPWQGLRQSRSSLHAIWNPNQGNCFHQCYLLSAISKRDISCLSIMPLTPSPNLWDDLL